MKFRTALILVALSALMLSVTVQPGIGSPIETIPAGASAGDELLDLDFKGGTAEDYVNAIRKKLIHINIVIMPSAAKLPMPPIQLRSVKVHTAIKLLDGQTAQIGTDYIEVHTRFLPGDDRDGSTSIYSIDADGFTEPSRTSIFAVNTLLSGDLVSDDLMTSIETMLDLVSEDYAPAQIRFHPETGILMIRGHPVQVDAIKDLIGELHDSVRQSRHRSEQNAANKKTLEKSQRNAEKNQQLQVEMNLMQLTLTEMETRYELQLKESAGLQVMLTQCDTERRQLSNENHIRKLQLQELQQKLNAIRNGSE